MPKKILAVLVLVGALGCGCPRQGQVSLTLPFSSAADVRSDTGPLIQVAILLDTSNSMDNIDGRVASSGGS
jgi:hypothetical protein